MASSMSSRRRGKMPATVAASVRPYATRAARMGDKGAGIGGEVEGVFIGGEKRVIIKGMRDEVMSQGQGRVALCQSVSLLALFILAE
jgi:hypothetical protein